jgi:hypothetical protein
MYPQRDTNIDYGILIDESSMTDENKDLCKELCKVGLCLSCFCSAYLILFLGVINSELNMNIMNMTYF